MKEENRKVIFDRGLQLEVCFFHGISQPFLSPFGGRTFRPRQKGKLPYGKFSAAEREKYILGISILS